MQSVFFFTKVSNFFPFDYLCIKFECKSVGTKYINLCDMYRSIKYFKFLILNMFIFVCISVFYYPYNVASDFFLQCFRRYN